MCSSLNLFRNPLRIIIFLFALLVVDELWANEEAFYLLDDIDIQSFSQHDQEIIDSCLKVYHQSDDPLLRSNALLFLVNNIGDDRWGLFQEYLYEYVQAEVDKSDGIVKDSLVGYLITSLNNLAIMELDRGNYEAAEKFYQANLIYSKTLRDSSGVANTYAGMGYMYRLQGDVTQAIEYSLRAKTLHEEMDNKFGQAMSLQNLGNLYHTTGEIQLAIASFEKAISYFSLYERPFSSASCNTDLGIVYESIGNIPRAVECFTQSIEVYREIGNAYGIALSYAHIGDMYFKQGENTLAIQNFHKSLASYRELDFPASEAFALVKLGNAYTVKDQFDSAFFYFEEAIKLDSAYGNMIGLARGNYGIGKLYLKQGKLQQALASCELALELFQQVDYLQSIVACETTIGEIYFAIGEIESAREIGLDALKKSQEFGDPALSKNASLLLAQIGEELGDYKLAYEMYMLYAMMKDSVENQDNKSLLLRLTLEQEYLEKTKALNEQKLKDEILLNKQAQKLKEQKYLGVIFIALIIIVVLWVLWRRSKYESKIAWLKEGVLKSQLKPHFIFNVLMSIQSLILQSKYDDALFYLSEIASFMRSELNSISLKVITVAKELEISRQYLSLEKLRFKDKLNFEFIDDLSPSQKLIEIPPLILQPLMENSIVHGFDSIDYPGVIRITCRVEENFLNIVITDNGRGLKTPIDAKKSSKGLQIVRDRLRLHHSENSMDISSSADGFEVVLKIYINQS